MEIKRLCLLVIGCVLVAGCSGGSSGSGTTRGGDRVNGSLTGEIWVSNKFGSSRFNLQTGVQTPVSESHAWPSPDGTLYAEFVDGHRYIDEAGCLSPRPLDLINFRNSSTNALVSSFESDLGLGGPVRISHDNKYLIVLVATDKFNCGDQVEDKVATVFTLDGTLVWKISDNARVYDWTADGRIAVGGTVDDSEYFVGFVSAPGSESIAYTGFFNFNKSTDSIRIDAMRVSPDGTQIVMEDVLGQSQFLSGARYRDARILSFMMDEFVGNVMTFSERSGSSRVNAPVFSPDGKWVLVTEDYAGGSVVNLEADIDFTFTDVPNRLSVFPVYQDSASYVLAADIIGQLLPPEQYEETVRPLFYPVDGGGVKPFGYNPLYDQSWTPVVR